MPTKIKEYYRNYKKIIMFILIILCLPLITLILESIFNIGVYLGTFTRYLFALVVS